MARDEGTPRTLDELLTRDSLKGVPVDEVVAAFRQARREADRQEADLRAARKQQAQMIARLNAEYELSYDKIAQLLGLSRATVNRWARNATAAE